MGMSGPQSITITDIKSYCEFIQVDCPDDRSDFLQLIQAMDSKWMKAINSKNSPSKK